MGNDDVDRYYFPNIASYISDDCCYDSGDDADDGGDYYSLYNVLISVKIF
ncbi:hypothetical protein OEV98_13890 [Caldibacillus lycopersici]|uniref:Uncharacterized protein n=1 Tax=Perspicuibacillus lycopersici TaxID=1325689 RepID=A0AAE3IWE6_9BACI|nr:hypothetical protein [Perspicuibacillus lycopersici]MCU9614631.1 hypothetical protein [Perspicuibacillus lycopersici]